MSFGPNDTIKVTVNGEVRTLSRGSGLSDLLRNLAIDPGAARGIAVAVNDEVVRQDDWNEQVLQEGDRVEVVEATQGG